MRYHRQHFFFPRILLQTLLRTERRDNTIYSPVSPTDSNCEARRRTKVTRASCRINLQKKKKKTTDLTMWRQQTTMFKIKRKKSRLYHKYAVVVQDEATKWVERCPCKNQSSSGDCREVSKILTSIRKSRIHFLEQFSGIYESLRRVELESREIHAAQIRNKWSCRPSCTTS